MSHFIADAIRAQLNDLRAAARGSDTVALLAVLDKCEQMRSMRVGPNNESVGRDIADEFESVIARKLGINPEETS